MMFLPLVIVLRTAEIAVAASLAAAQAPAAIYDALVPPRPRRVDGERATREYARENGLEE